MLLGGQASRGRRRAMMFIVPRFTPSVNYWGAGCYAGEANAANILASRDTIKPCGRVDGFEAPSNPGNSWLLHVLGVPPVRGRVGARPVFHRALVGLLCGPKVFTAPRCRRR